MVKYCKKKEDEEMKKRILFIDDDEKLLDEERRYFEDNGYETEGATNGVDGLKKFSEFSPSFTVVETFLPVIDGREVIERIKNAEGKIIAVSSVKNETAISDSLSAGADAFMLKPYSLPLLKKRVDGLRSFARYDHKQAGLEKRLSEIFITVGIPAHIKGYQFLREAIKKAIDSPDIINSITKRLYPEVAEKFATSPSKVERAIRHAIEVAWNKGRIESINSLFGLKVYSSNEKPTNGEFIALVADKMMLEEI